MRRSAVLAAAALGAGGASLGVAAIADAGGGSSTTSTTAPVVRQRSFFGARPGTVGTVKSVASASFTLVTPENTTVTVDVTNATQYRDFAKSSASLADVTVGEHVAVTGSDTANTVAATEVFIGGPGGPGGPGGFRGWGG